MARKSRQTAATEAACNGTKRWYAGVYRRLSVEDGDDMEANSIANQEKVCRNHLLTDRTITVEKVYTDNGYSGMNYVRPGFREMMDDLDSGLINCVVVKDVSRFGRQYLMTSEYLQRFFPDRGIRFIAVNDDYDSARPDSDAEGLLMPFKMILNDSYAKDISKKIRSSISAKMNTGAYLPSSGSIPYGYTRNPASGSYDIDEAAASIVRRVFRMRETGTSINAIVSTLNDEEVPSPGRLRFLRGLSRDPRFETATWTRATIRKLLCDEVYLGNRIHGRVRRDRIGARKEKRPSAAWKVIPDAHPAIVSRELFDAVQAVNQDAEERRTGYHAHADCAVDLRAVLRGKLFCGDCGARMVALKHDQRISSPLPPVIIYQCGGYQRSNRKSCSNHYTRQEDVLRSIRTVLNCQLASAADLEDALRSFHRHSVLDAGGESIRSCRVKRGNVEAKLEQLLIDVTGGVINESEYRELKAHYLSELSKLTQEETETAARLSELRHSEDAARKWLEQLQHYRKVDMLDRELMDALVNRVSIFQNGRIHVELNYKDPFRDVCTSEKRRREVMGEDGASDAAI